MNTATARQYLWSFITALIVFTILSFYLYFRRGYYDLYIANKAVSSVAFILLCLVLLLGPISRLYQLFDHLLIFRKELGITAFLFAFLHGLVSLIGLPDHFPLENYLKFPITFVAGLLSLVILAILFVLSAEKIVKAIDRRRWWHIQNWGVRIAALLVFLHVLPMKYNGWIKWYTFGGGNELLRPYLPPASVLVISFGVFTLAIRLSELLGQNLARKIITLTVIIYIIFLGVSFGLGINHAPKALPLDWETCIKLPNSKIIESLPPVCVGTGGRTATQPIN